MNPPLQEENLHVDCAYKIIYEDEHVLIVNKPAPLPVHPVGRFQQRTLTALLEKDFGRSFHLVNRLDSETTGIVLFAKDKETAGKLGREFAKRRVEKEYLGLVFGKPEKEYGEIAYSLGWMEHPEGFRLRCADPAGEEAVTTYQLIQTSGEYSLLLLMPQTGRTHQIRIHLALAGMPLIGDKLYIDPLFFQRYRKNGWQEEMREALKLPRLALHAYRLKLQEGSLWEAPLPDDMALLLKELNLFPSAASKG